MVVWQNMKMALKGNKWEKYSGTKTKPSHINFCIIVLTTNWSYIKTNIRSLIISVLIGRASKQTYSVLINYHDIASTERPQCNQIDFYFLRVLIQRRALNYFNVVIFSSFHQKRPLMALNYILIWWRQIIHLSYKPCIF